jgi:hypothetical protein
MNFWYICGLSGSGKGVLRVLLDDSHKNIINCPFQNFGFEILSKDFDKFLIRKKTTAVSIRHEHISKGAVKIDGKIFSIGEFIKIISPSLGDLLDSTFWKFIRAGSNEDREQYVEFNFNYNEFYKKLTKPFNEFAEFENKLDLYYHFINCFVSIWKNIDSNNKDTIFMTSAPNGINAILDIKRSFNHRKNYKLLCMHRDKKGYFFTNYKRFSKKQSNKNFLFFFKMVISPNIWKKYKIYKREILNSDKSLQKIIYFNDIINKTEITMRDVAEFLGINFHPKILIPSLNSQTLENNFTTKILDNPDLDLGIIKKNILSLVIKII